MSLTRPRDARAAVPSPVGRLGGFGHRPALDGLRTVAVYLVVLFHAGADSFEGGFIGVDLFFVLSGFLVTNVLLTELDREGGLRLWRFYARRVRRLLPAASLTIVGTAGLMLVVSNHVDRLAVVADARAASLWFANWHFLAKGQSYFAEGDLESPFLHFWSLAIEEQFYLAFPLVMVAAWWWTRGRPRRLAPLLLVLTMAGLAAQAWIARSDPSTAYYATHARIYQLLAGATAGAWFRVHDVPAWLRRHAGRGAAIGLVSLVLVASSAFPVDVATRGIVAALVGVTLIGALEADRHGRVAGLLAREPIGYLGRISYGTYLWHWPLLVVVERVFDLGVPAALLVSGVGGTAMAALSQRVLEQPIRRARALDRWPRPVVAAGVAVALLVGVLAAPTVLDSPRRPSSLVAEAATRQPPADADLGLGPVPASIDVAAIRNDRAMGPPDCFAAPPDGCVVVDGPGLAVHLVGDSHAGMMLPALEALARTNGWRLTATTLNACPWVEGLYTGEPGTPQAEACARRRTQAYEHIIPDIQPDVIVAMMAARVPDLDGKGVFSPRADLAEATPTQMLQALTLPGVQRLAELAPRVVVLESVPRATEDMLACLSAATQQEECVFEAPPAPGAEDDRQVRAAVARVAGATSVDLDRLACPRLPLCTPLQDGLVVRRDAHHLSVGFVRARADEVGALLADTGAFGSVAPPDREDGT